MRKSLDADAEFAEMVLSVGCGHCGRPPGLPCKSAWHTTHKIRITDGLRKKASKKF